MTEELQTLSNLVKMFLQDQAPILSGNLLREITTTELVQVNDNEITFCIKAPFYDTKLWRKKGVIVRTHDNFDGIYHYAMWLNEEGAFGTRNESMYWVNRAINEACSYMPDAEIINKLEL